MTDWKAKAAALKDYPAGNPWEQMLRRALLRANPRLVGELAATKDLEPYLRVMTAGAMDYADQLEKQGTPPDVARELAMEYLLPASAEPPARWEQAGAEEDLTEPARQFLTRRPSSDR